MSVSHSVHRGEEVCFRGGSATRGSASRGSALGTGGLHPGRGCIEVRVSASRGRGSASGGWGSASGGSASMGKGWPEPLVLTSSGGPYSGRHALYWNAFLCIYNFKLINFTLINFKVVDIDRGDTFLYWIFQYCEKGLLCYRLIKKMCTRISK